MTAIAPKDRSFGFLVSDVARLLRRSFDRRLEPLGLTQAQWRALAHLWREPGMKQAELAERLEIQPITLTRLVDRMEAAGWVERRDDPNDRRASRLHCTEQALPLVEQMQDRVAETLAEALAGLSPAARRELVGALALVKENLTAAQPASAQAAVNVVNEVEHVKPGTTAASRRGR